MRPLLAFTPLALTLLAGCANDNDLKRVADNYGTGEGSITGRVCDEARSTWLEGATVYTHIIDESGELRDTRQATTDVDGKWLLEDLADGVYTVYVQYGSTTLDMFDVTVDGTAVALDEPNCSGALNLEVAVVSGDFDDFEEVLNAVGISGYHPVDGQTGAELVQFLTNAEQLATYDAVFFAGGHLEEGIFYSTDGSEQATVDTVKAALQAYVDGGGVVIASDWSYDVVEQTWPHRIEFYGDDTVPDAAQIGTPDTIQADVLDADLEDTLGHAHINVSFDMDAWPVVESVDDSTVTLLSGTAPWQIGTEIGTTPDSPLAIQFASGDGEVVYTPWRMMSNLDGGALDVIRWIVDTEI